jgi:broad specificity phosphatase PhoE
MPEFITFIRHFRTRIDPNLPPSQWSLADDPSISASTLATRCTTSKVTSIATSPEPKATQTAACLSKLVGFPYVTDPRLAEVNRDAGTFLYDYPASAALYLTRDPTFTHPWEPYEQVERRIRSFLLDLSTQEGHPLLVTHGLLMSLCLAPVLKQPPAEFWKSLAFGQILTFPAATVFNTWLD